MNYYLPSQYPSIILGPVVQMWVSAGTPELGGGGGAGGAAAPVALYQEGQGRGKVPFQFKGLPWRNSELSEMLVRFFYEFASENARNAVIELQE
jgi:hypothetical protein